MPVMKPATSERNFTPTSTALGSLVRGTPGTEEAAQMVALTMALLVVNDQENGEAMLLPARSVALTVAVYAVSGSRAAVPWEKVAMWVASSYVKVVAMVLPEESLSTKEIEPI